MIMVRGRRRRHLQHPGRAVVDDPALVEDDGSIDHAAQHPDLVQHDHHRHAAVQPLLGEGREQALAVVFEPPATGPAGRLLSPSCTSTSSSDSPSSSAAVWPITV